MTKEIVDQLKKLNQNIERFLRMIDPTLHPERSIQSLLKQLNGVIELDQSKRYIFFLNPDITEKDFYEGELGKDFAEFVKDFPIMIIGGEFIRDFQEKDEDIS